MVDITSQIDVTGLQDFTTADAADVLNPVNNLITVINALLNGSQHFEAVWIKHASAARLALFDTVGTTGWTIEAQPAASNVFVIGQYTSNVYQGSRLTISNTGLVTVTGALTVSGVFTASAAAATGALTSASVAATGALTVGTTATITGTLTANKLRTATRPTYGAPTGTATRTTFATTTVTLPQLAERVKAIIDDLRTAELFA